MARCTLAVLLTLGLVGPVGAQAVTASKPGIDATVTASVAPTRLPARGVAPVTLTIAGTVTRADPTVPSPLRSIDLLLDRKLAVDTTGLPICPLGKLHGGAPVAYARKHCGAALIGSGTVDEAFRFPEGSAIPPYDRHYAALFFNGRGGVLMYIYFPHPAGPSEAGSDVVSIGSGHRLSIRMGAGLGSTASFRFRLGRTWHDDGERHSYLSGRCKGGTLKNQITLSFADGDVSEAAPQRCT